MTNWTPALEKNIRAIGDYAEDTLRLLINPDISAAGTLTRIFTSAARTGTPLMKKTCKMAGFEFKSDWREGLEKLSKVAAANNSDAADKINHVLAAADSMMQEIKNAPGGNIEKLRLIKKQKFDF